MLSRADPVTSGRRTGGRGIEKVYVGASEKEEGRVKSMGERNKEYTE